MSHNWERLANVLERMEAGTPPPTGAGLFGASLDPDEASLVIIPVPWDATVSYGAGTANAPAELVLASHQLDLEDGAFVQPFKAGIALLPESQEMVALAKKARPRAEQVIARAASGVVADDPDLRFVNDASRQVDEAVYEAAKTRLEKGQIVAVLGGDHSTPLGLMQALGDQCPDGFGVLHIDAHHDLRCAYEGFVRSHASIMYNALQEIPALKRLVQVGIRDYSQEEKAFAQSQGERVHTFYARNLFAKKARGETWASLTEAMLKHLPKAVYVSFDIDGLDPVYCPSTGTPVPGGLSYDEATYLLEALAKSGRKIIGFDLTEVTPGADGDQWDANVGARILYKLCGATLASQGRCAFQADF